jgi:hypothetical protein
VEVFAGLEADGFAGGDRNFGTGAWVAAYAGFAGFNREDAEAAEFDAVPFDEGLFHGFEDGIDGCLCLGAYQSCALDDALDKILFDQVRTSWEKRFKGCFCGILERGSFPNARDVLFAMVERELGIVNASRLRVA